ncbi:MAG TPA: hypothetical protein VIX73_03280, partial [Kofleriaceae bacterium]
MPKRLAPQPLRVQLGGARYPLAAGDVFLLGFGDGPSVRGTVRGYSTDGMLDLDAGTTLAPKTIALHGLRTAIAPDDYSATLDLTPSSSQPPWLMSFANDPSPASLRDTLLPYVASEALDDDHDLPRRRFRFARSEKLVDIFVHAGNTDTPLYLLTNEQGELRREFYTKVDDTVASNLKSLPPANFFDAPDDAQIDRLILTSSAWAGKQLDAARPVIVCSTASVPPGDGEAAFPADRFPELAIAEAEPRRVATGVVLQSLRFNTGNFIPVASQGTTPDSAAVVIKNALRISARAIDGAGAPIPDEPWHDVDYLSLVDLSKLADTVSGKKTPSGTLAAFDGMTWRDAHLMGALKPNPQYKYAASFSPAGVCTLHFLLIDEALSDRALVQIEAQYEVDPGRTGDGLASGPLYPLETRVTGFDPATQLALLAPGALKPDALVFVRQPRAAGAPALQWAKVDSVVGPIVTVSPPLAVDSAPGSRYEPIAVTALGKLAAAAKLDADYYATVAKAALVPTSPPDAGASHGPSDPTWWSLALRDRLPLAALVPPGGDPSPLAALIPGDVVVVYDERRRKAWSAHRLGGATDGTSAAGWEQWPDFQHRAIVKRVDHETGLLVLSAPLPDAFEIRWRLDADAAPISRLTAHADDVSALRVLPQYGTPTQGRRTLSVLGSGDATRRFARFVSLLGAGTGSVVVPLADGVTTGNLEVLAFDPEKGTWIRWLRRDTLARAGKKDAAFVLGFRPVDAAGQVPVSVLFGDGLTGRVPPTGADNLYLR